MKWLILVFLAGCCGSPEPPRPCVVPPGVEGPFVNSQDLECPSRICAGTPRAASCTEMCESDDDCGHLSHAWCPGGYTCATLGLQVCRCRDDLDGTP